MAAISTQTILNLPASQKVCIIAGLILAICGSYYMLSFKPAREEITNLNGELTKLQTKYNEQKKILANLPRFKQELKDLQLKFEESLKLLPNTREIPSLLTNISNLARESGLTILLFQPKPELNKGFYAEIPVEMEVQGKYHDLGRFADRISKLERIVNISNIEMTSARSREAEPGTLEASFNATTFKFIKEQPQPKSKKRRGRRRR